MPAYISHAIMIEKLYHDYRNDQKLFRRALDVDDLKTYSLGIDLSSLSNTLSNNPHEKYTQDFFLFMIKYIKDHNLVDNCNVLALLYGHIAHYFLDVSTHPFIYYMEKSYPSHTIIPTHHLIEAYLDSYLAEKVLKKDIMMINAGYFNRGSISKEAEILLNEIYSDVYHGKYISLIYKKTLKLFSLLENILKSGKFSKKRLYEISGLFKYLKQNKLSFSDLTNESFLIYFNPFNGKIDRKSFIELFYRAIYDTLNAIDEVNAYLYGNSSLDALTNVFSDLSYDTGLPCELGKKIVYTKKR